MSCHRIQLRLSVVKDGWKLLRRLETGTAIIGAINMTLRAHYKFVTAPPAINDLICERRNFSNYNNDNDQIMRQPGEQRSEQCELSARRVGWCLWLLAVFPLIHFHASAVSICFGHFCLKSRSDILIASPVCIYFYQHFLGASPSMHA